MYAAHLFALLPVVVLITEVQDSVGFSQMTQKTCLSCSQSFNYTTSAA